MGLKSDIFDVFGTLLPFSRKLVVRISPNFHSFHATISAVRCQEKSKIVLSEVGQKCEKPRNLGFGALWGSPPYGAITPDLTGPSYSPVAPEKNSFYSGGIGPQLGEMWGFEIFKITVFEPSLAKSRQKARNDVNLQICGIVQLQGNYKMAQKIWAKGPLQGAGAPGKSEQGGILAFRPNFGEAVTPDLDDWLQNVNGVLHSV